MQPGRVAPENRKRIFAPLERKGCIPSLASVLLLSLLFCSFSTSELNLIDSSYPDSVALIALAFVLVSFYFVSQVSPN